MIRPLTAEKAHAASDERKRGKRCRKKRERTDEAAHAWVRGS
jgi:hypothetical protein